MATKRPVSWRKSRRLRSAQTLRSISIAVAVFILVFSALGALTVAVPDASAGSQMQCIIEHNSVGGVSSSATATNDTTSWTEGYPVAATLYWGNTSSPYPFSQSVYDGGTSFSVFLNYLEPATTYYFEISAPNDQIGSICIDGATYSGSFTTAAWPINAPSDPPEFINGTITNSTGASPSGNTPLEINCLNPSLDGPGGPIYTYATDGYFYQLVWDPNYVPLGCVEYKDPIVVEVLNYQNPDNLNVQYWPGQWNESLIIWAPQFVNFVLPHNYVGPYSPVVLDFSNAPAGYSELEYEACGSLSTTLTDSWSISGGVAGSGVGSEGSSSTTVTNQMCGGEGSEDGDLVYLAEYETSGTVEFNAIYRGWAETSVNLYGLPVNACFPSSDCDPSYAAPTDWLYPGTSASDVYFLPDSTGHSVHGDLVPAGYELFGAVTTSTTSAVEGGFSVTLGIDADLPGVGSIDLSASTGWSQTSSTSNSNNLEWYAVVPQGGTQTCFDAFAQGGSLAQLTADVVGIWAWAPTYYSSNSTWGCP